MLSLGPEACQGGPLGSRMSFTLGARFSAGKAGDAPLGPGPMRP